MLVKAGIILPRWAIKHIMEQGTKRLERLGKSGDERDE